ncbi:MAG: DoxX family protein [Candidatus Pacebacteria bacterium]|nr:DoxX family protein [Candidatus Paceibacterota bacterium]
MITVINRTSRFLYKRSLGLLLIRLALGLLFFTHGLMKVEQLSLVAAMFEHLGFFPWVGFFIAWLELIGGLALILGIATRVFAALFGIEMLVATIIVGFARGIDIEFVLCIVSFALALMGSGRYSVFKMECDKCGGMLCNGKTGECVAVS